MPAQARCEIVDPMEIGVYHCWNRCVRRAWLCGDDPVTGENRDHRRDWTRSICQEMAKLFAIDICFHAEMSNHLHLELRNRPDIVSHWSDEEVVRRWLTIAKLVKDSLPVHN